MIILVIFIIPGIGRQKNAGYRPAIIFPGFSAHDRMGISFFSIKNLLPTGENIQSLKPV